MDKSKNLEVSVPKSPSHSLDSSSSNEVPSDDNSSNSSDHKILAAPEEPGRISPPPAEPGRRSPLLFCLGNNAKRIQSRLNMNGNSKKDTGPLQIEKSKASFLYDKEGRTYIDCISGVSHVGHCHPKIIGVYQHQLGTLGSGAIATEPGHAWHNIQLNGIESGMPKNRSTLSTEPENIKTSTKVERPKSSSRLINRLLKTLKVPKIEAALTFSSGSQANDMAIQMARAYTGNYDVLIFEESFHGGLSTGADMSAKMMIKADPDQEEDSPSPDSGHARKKSKFFANEDNVDDQSLPNSDDEHASKASTSRSDSASVSSYDSNSNVHDKEDNEEEHDPRKTIPIYATKSSWVHVLPIPDLKFGCYRHEEPSVQIEKYLNDAKAIINSQMKKGRKFACLMSEPVFTFYSGMIPSSAYFQKICSYIREIGAIIIMDEVQTGVGRIGHHFWAFQGHKLQPEIVTAGKALNNGHPVAFVFTSHKILESLGSSLVNVHRPTPIQEALGNCVLDIMTEERLIENCKDVGEFIQLSIKDLMEKHNCINNVNGKGLLIGIEFSSKDDRYTPNAPLAITIRDKLREKQIVVAVEGKNRNVVYLMPPLCFTKANAIAFVEALDDIIYELGPEDLEVKTIPNSEPAPVPKFWSRKRNAHGRNPLHPANRGMLRSRPGAKEEPPKSYSFWNRGSNKNGPEDDGVGKGDRPEAQTQNQYHFFSPGGNPDPSSKVSMNNLRNNQSSLDSTEGESVEQSLSRNSKGTTQNTATIPEAYSSHGTYDDLD